VATNIFEVRRDGEISGVPVKRGGMFGLLFQIFEFARFAVLLNALLFLSPLH
jgi:hypothetical protein